MNLINSIYSKIKNIDAFSMIRFLLILLPFTFLFYFETTPYGYVSSKVTALGLIIIFIAIIFIGSIHRKIFFQYLIEKWQIIKKDKIFISVSIFVLISLLATINSADFLNSFAGSFMRWDGFLTLFCIYLYFTLSLIFLDKKSFKLLNFNILLVSILLFSSLFLSFRLNFDRPYNFIGNPIFIGQFFLFSLFFIPSFIKNIEKNYRNLLYFFLTIIFILSILISGTRGIFFGLFISFIILMFIWIFNKERINFGKINSKHIAIISLILISIFSILIFSTKNMPFWKDIPFIGRVVEIGEKDATTVARIVNNKISYSMASHPDNILDFIIGIGPEQYYTKWYTHYDSSLYRYDRAVFDRAHNMFFDILIMKGILGLISFFSIIYFTIKKSKVTSFESFSISFFILIAYLGQGLFAFDSYTTTIMFFLIILFIIQSKKYEQ